MPIDPSEVKWDSPKGIDPKAVVWDAPTPSAADRELYGPTRDMSLGQRLVAGFGKAAPDLFRGAKQLYGAVSPTQDFVNKATNLQGDIDESKRLDAPLMATGGGLAGNVLGNIALSAPTVMAPAAATLVGAATIGGGLGALQPTATGDSRALNVGIGGVAGPLGIMAGRVLGAGIQGVKGLVEPLYEAGQNRIAGRMLHRFADDPSKIAAATNAPTSTGALPTLAEQTGDPGIARLQDALRAADPQIGNQIGNRLSENNAARVNALRGLAGEDGARAGAVTARGDVAKQLYADAFRADGSLTPSQLKAQAGLLGGDKIQTLLATPAIANARKSAQTIAADLGKTIDDPAGSIEGLHYMKLAMDDAISAAKRGGTAAGDNAAAGIKAAQSRLVDALETLSPGYKTARETYAQMSKPVNSMDVAAQVAKKGLSNGSDLSGTPTINRNALMGALKDEPALIKQATGRSAGNALGDVMAPQDEALLRAIAAETDRAGAVATAGNGPGSATAQRMASQNLLQQITGPLGLPKSWAESSLANTLMKPLNMIYGGVAEPKIQQALAQAVLDPAKAQAMIQAATPAQRGPLIAFLQRSAAARAVPTASNALTQRAQQ